jgi:hypothetical protein
MAPGLVSQTIERARRLQAGCELRWLTPRPRRLNVDNLIDSPAATPTRRLTCPFARCGRPTPRERVVG